MKLKNMYILFKCILYNLTLKNYSLISFFSIKRISESTIGWIDFIIANPSQKSPIELK